MSSPGAPGAASAAASTAPPAWHVVAVDASPQAVLAFNYAVENTPRTDGLVIVNGLHQHQRPKVYPAEKTGFYTDPQMDQRSMASYRSLMAVFASRCKVAKRRCEFEGVKFYGPGDLGEGVNDSARRHNAQSIIVGCRGMGGSGSGWFMGSVSQSIMNRASRPVTIVRSEEEEYKRGSAAFEFIQDGLQSDPNSYGHRRTPLPENVGPKK